MNNVYFCNYTIGSDAYDNVAEVCLPFGKTALLIGGEKALHAGKEKLMRALHNDITIAETHIFGTDCNEKSINECVAVAKETGVDMIFGMGGGKALDTAKAAAFRADLPVFTFPTIAATCAATTALSVLYNEDGSFDRFEFFLRPARHCFINLDIIANAPFQYLQAGMGDTIGKHFECHFSARGDELSHSSALGREISNMCYEPLVTYGTQALQDVRDHITSHALEEAVLANIVSTGLVSLLVLDEYNGALAHSLYYALCSLPHFEEDNLHGNVVAYGVLVQLLVDNQKEEALRLKSFLKTIDIRTTLNEMHVPLDRDVLEPVLQDAISEPDMSHIPYPITANMLYDAIVNTETL